MKILNVFVLTIMLFISGVLFIIASITCPMWGWFIETKQDNEIRKLILEILKGERDD